MKKYFEEQLEGVVPFTYVSIQKLTRKDKTQDYFGDFVKEGDSFLYFYLKNESSNLSIKMIFDRNINRLDEYEYIETPKKLPIFKRKES